MQTPRLTGLFLHPGVKQLTLFLLCCLLFALVLFIVDHAVSGPCLRKIIGLLQKKQQSFAHFAASFAPKLLLGNDLKFPAKIAKVRYTEYKPTMPKQTPTDLHVEKLRFLAGQLSEVLRSVDHAIQCATEMRAPFRVENGASIARMEKAAQASKATIDRTLGELTNGVHGMSEADKRAFSAAEEKATYRRTKKGKGAG